MMKEVGIVTMVEKRLSFLKAVPYLPQLFDKQLEIYTWIFRPMVFKKMMEFSRIVKNLADVSTSFHKYGGLQFNVDNKEIGHMHGDGLVDIHLNKKLAQIIILLGLAEDHHVLKNSGWISFPLRRNQDLNIIVKIAHLGYALRRGNDTGKLINGLFL